MHSQIVRTGYDKIANNYLADRGRLKSDKYVRKLLKVLPKSASILDLGCGAGVPVDDILLRGGCSVTGMDISEVQIQLARKHCPAGEYQVGDMEMLAPRAYSVDAVVSFYAFFHIPRTKHSALLRTVATYLRPEGYLLLTMGDRDFEGIHDLYGAPMWSSQWGTLRNREMVEQAGFSVIFDEVDRSGGEMHQVLLARRA